MKWFLLVLSRAFILDERERRLFAAAEAGTAGYGGVSAVARATVIAPNTIIRCLMDLLAFALAQHKVRRAGGDALAYAQQCDSSGGSSAAA